MTVIDKKHIYICTNTWLEDPPKIYLDFYTNKSNLKYKWRSYNTFNISIGFLRKYLTVELYWGFVERKRTTDEEERYQRMQKFINEVGD